jgi:hypothetical protein
MATVSGVTNVMALAKQVQFMSLTCEIDGVPQVYKDFADSLKAFNFDAFDYIPYEKLGVPTAKDIETMKQNWIANLKKQLGIEHATLLLQYCAVPKFLHGVDHRLYQNAILERQASHAAALTQHMNAYKLRKAAKEAENKRKKAAAARANATHHLHQEEREERKLSEINKGDQSIGIISTVRDLGGYWARRFLDAVGGDGVAKIFSIRYQVMVYQMLTFKMRMRSSASEM